MAPILNLHNLGHTYPGAAQPTFGGLTVSVEPGQFIAIVGSSGVGKSTLLRCVAGLVPAYAGAIELNLPPDPQSRRSAFVFQDARLMPWKRLRANVAFGLKGLALNRAERDARVDEVMRLTLIGDLARRWPHQLSGGQAQRAGIARALAVHPRLLLMDEPFSAVDAITREKLQDEMAGIWASTGLAVLFVTHDIKEAVYLADRVIVLSGTPARIVADEVITLTRPRARDSATLRQWAKRITDRLRSTTSVPEPSATAAPDAGHPADQRQSKTRRRWGRHPETAPLHLRRTRETPPGPASQPQPLPTARGVGPSP